MIDRLRPRPGPLAAALFAGAAVGVAAAGEWSPALKATLLYMRDTFVQMIVDQASFIAGCFG